MLLTASLAFDLNPVASGTEVVLGMEKCFSSSDQIVASCIVMGQVDVQGSCLGCNPDAKSWSVQWNRARKDVGTFSHSHNSAEVDGEVVDRPNPCLPWSKPAGGHFGV